MYLDFRNASILKRGKISLLCPGKKEFVVLQNGSEWLDVLSPFCEMSLYFRPCFGYLWSFYHRKQQSNVFEFEDSGNLTFKVFCTRISRKDGLISILLAPNRRLQRRKNV